MVRAIRILPFLLGLGLLPRTGEGGTVVSPAQVKLARGKASTLVTVRNDDRVPRRYELSVSRWTQDEWGRMQLVPTEDVIFFPGFLVLAPGEEKKVRVGTTVEAIDRERTYRLFLQELAPPEGPAPGTVAILTRIGIPIFVQPKKPASSLRIEEAKLEEGTVSFRVANAGSSFAFPEKIAVRGFGEADAQSLQETVNGWYILAGERRRYEFPLDPASCAKSTRLRIEVVHEGKTHSSEVPVAPARCRR